MFTGVTNSVGAVDCKKNSMYAENNRQNTNVIG